MFGRVIPNKSELKFKEFDVYRAYYCGICGQLRHRGYLSALSLNYDMTFLAMLLNSLYEEGTTKKNARCICHMCKKHCEATDKYSDYVADMTLLLSYYKCIDDFNDDKSIIKLLYSFYLKPKVKKLSAKYPSKAGDIKSNLEMLSRAEKTDNLEECANLFGNITATIFTPNDDMWADELYNIGFYLGKFIYIADAYSDIKDDIRKKRPNPLTKLYSTPNFDQECDIILNMMAAEATREFEKLPLVENIEILRNIMYSGIWQNLNHRKES